MWTRPGKLLKAALLALSRRVGATSASRLLREPGGSGGLPLWLRRGRPALATFLVLLPGLALAAPAGFEAEALGAAARIVGGGELVLIHDPPDGRFTFSGGAGVSFVPGGQLSALELTLPVAAPGVYRLRCSAVLGPSCGVYQVFVDGELRGWQNFAAGRTHHTSQDAVQVYGVQTRRFAVRGDAVVIRFVNENAGPRGRNLVLDRLELLPEPPPTFPPPEASDPIAPGERYGPELLTNGDAEAFLPEDRFTQRYQIVRGWAFNSAIPAGQPVIVRDPAQAQAGQVVLCLAPDPLEDNAILYQPGIPVRYGHRYRLTFQARGTGMVNVAFYQTSPHRDLRDTVRGGANFALTPAWQQFSLVFGPSVAGKVEQTGCAFAALSGSRLYLDQVSLRELLP